MHRAERVEDARLHRHFSDHAIGLLPPTRVGANGYRFYDARALVRLQRILLLRELGMGLGSIADILVGQRDDVQALTLHLAALRRERARLEDRIESVEITIAKLNRGEALMADEILNGFDPAKYREEVIERWGNESYAQGDRWWRGMSGADRSAWLAHTRALQDAWARAAASGADPEGVEAQALARRHAEWLAGIPGTPRAGAGPSKGYFLGLADLYVEDERFTRHHGGPAGVGFVRDAMKAYAEKHL